MRGLLKNAIACADVSQLRQCFAMVLSLGSLFLFCLLCLNAVAILNHRRFLARCKSPLQFLVVDRVYLFVFLILPPPAAA